MEIEVLGMGCARCIALEKNVRKALSELNIEAKVKKVEDMNIILNRGVMMTPALVINGNVVATGRVPSIEEIKKLTESVMRTLK